MSQIRGRFYLRLTSNGNLTGEFSHGDGSEIFTEGADRIVLSDDASSFVGTFESTWRDPTLSSSVLAKLKICKIGHIYDLEWMAPGQDFGRPRECLLRVC